MKINLLEPKVYNRISAGEVVERPASIVKELVENSIDAGADAITIQIENGGISLIEVSDNGSGIEKEDLTLAFTPHATSKIKSIDDLDNIESLGFRGEALASIASVCHVHLSSRVIQNEVGYSIKVDGGQFSQISEVARARGTTISCRDLFYNTPARAKFLRKPKYEESEIEHIVEKFMLAHPEISFTYYVDGNLIYNTTPGSMQDIIYTIYGREVYDNLIPVNHEEGGIKLVGFVTKPKISKSNRTYQTLFVNNRYVENYLVSQAVQGVYESFLMKGRFPIYVLNLKVATDRVDVNVHPSKREVKFDEPNHIFGIVRRAVEEALLSVDQIASFVSEGDENAEIKGKELSEPFNEQGFNPVIKNNNEPLSDTEGVSYRGGENRATIEQRDIAVPKTTPNASDFEPLPDFRNMTLPGKQLPNNKAEKSFFFDQHPNNLVEQIIAEKSFLNADTRSEMKILGTIFKTYMVVELNDAVFFVDQHAAHERLLYDKLIKQVNNGNVVKQSLIAPFEFNVGPLEAQALEDSIKGLREMGFEIEKDGNKYQIHAVPLVLSNISLQDFVDELVKEGIHLERKPSSFIHEKLCQSACKHAIKAGDSITNDECAYIIDEVRKGVMLCPHGRPIVLELKQHEFEKLFKRIV